MVVEKNCHWELEQSLWFLHLLLGASHLFTRILLIYTNYSIPRYLRVNLLILLPRHSLKRILVSLLSRFSYAALLIFLNCLPLTSFLCISLFSVCDPIQLLSFTYPLWNIIVYLYCTFVMYVFSYSFLQIS